MKNKMRLLVSLTVGIMAMASGTFVDSVAWAQRPVENALAIVVTPRGIIPSKVTLRPGPLLG